MSWRDVEGVEPERWVGRQLEEIAILSSPGTPSCGREALLAQLHRTARMGADDYNEHWRAKLAELAKPAPTVGRLKP